MCLESPKTKIQKVSDYFVKPSNSFTTFKKLVGFKTLLLAVSVRISQFTKLNRLNRFLKHFFMSSNFYEFIAKWDKKTVKKCFLL